MMARHLQVAIAVAATCLVASSALTQGQKRPVPKKIVLAQKVQKEIPASQLVDATLLEEVLRELGPGR